MATIEIDKREFLDLVGEDFEDEKLMEEGSFLGVHWHSIEGDVCEVENYPNRPDCLSVEGLARAYRGFFGVEKGLESYTVQDGDVSMSVEGSVEEVRPFIGGAVVRNLELSDKIINGLIQLQEKIHKTMGRERKKIAIGLHDISSVEPPFTYKAVDPEAVEFQPLDHEENLDLNQILEQHEKGREYSWILEDEDKYPVIVDSDRQVLSFPPVINNQLTEVSSSTTDVFVDVTGTDHQSVMKALNIIATALSERDGDIEQVMVDGDRHPDLSSRSMSLDPDYLRDVSGLDLSDEDVVDRLEMMKYGARKVDEGVKLRVPCYRTDVMHEYDVIEDVLIAHRYRNVDPEVPELDQVGEQKSIQDTAEVVRDILTGIGATESMTYVHTSEEDLTGKMDVETSDYVKLENPLSEEYGSLRNLLIPSLMDVLRQNRQHSYPQRFFETGNVVEPDDSGTGASNRRKVAYVESGEEVDFTDARRALESLGRDLGLELRVEESNREFFKDSRSADVYLDGEKAGFVGEFSRSVLTSWGMEKPVSGFELDLEMVQLNLKN